MSSARLRKPFLILVVLSTCGGLVGITALHFIRQSTTNAYTRGDRLARELGCTACHGPGGLGGIKNPLSSLGFVPSFRSGGSITYRVQSFEDFKAWVVYGEPRPLWIDDALRSRYSVADGLIEMPAYGSAVSDRDLADLYAFYKAVSNSERPASTKAMKGRMLAHEHGCFGCHGWEGRGGTSNPGSLKRQIPSWDGEDFKELVTSDEELREWIREGRSRRIESRFLARLLTRNQIIRMPSYKEVLDDDELDAIVEYIHWLRSEKRDSREYWVRPDATTEQAPVARGRYLFRYAGCASCHNAKGNRGFPNPNALGDEIPAAYEMAEKMQIMIRLLQNEERLATARCSSYRAFHQEYSATRQLIIRGSIPDKQDGQGPIPPVKMPAWEERANSDGTPLSLADIDAILAYLIALQNRNAPTLEQVSQWLDKGSRCEEEAVSDRAETIRASGPERALAAIEAIDLSDQALDALPLFEYASFESHLKAAEEHYNRIQLFIREAFDIWVLRQRTPTHPTELFAIVQDNSESPSRAYYFQFLEDPKPQFVGFACFECHANGPRALRPMRSERIDPLTEADWATVRDWNDHIVSQGVVKTHFPDPASYDVESVEGSFWWTSSPSSWGTPLKLERCHTCHNSDGKVRSTLYKVHRFPILSLTRSHKESSGFMARNVGDEKSNMPSGKWLSHADRQCLERWLDGPPRVPSSCARSE